MATWVVGARAGARRGVRERREGMRLDDVWGCLGPARTTESWREYRSQGLLELLRLRVVRDPVGAAAASGRRGVHERHGMAKM